MKYNFRILVGFVFVTFISIINIAGYNFNTKEKNDLIMSGYEEVIKIKKSIITGSQIIPIRYFRLNNLF